MRFCWRKKGTGGEEEGGEFVVMMVVDTGEQMDGWMGGKGSWNG